MGLADSLRGSKRLMVRTLSDERLFWRFCAGLFFAFAVLKGFRAPGEWARTQALLDYRHGFIKRGLQGAVLSLLHLKSHRAMTVVFFVQLGGLFVLLWLLVRSARAERRFGSVAVAAVFGSSYAVTFLTHIVGYTDIPLAALTVLLLLIRNASARFWCALVVVPFALLVHESFLLLFFPVILFRFAVEILLKQAGGARRMAWRPAWRPAVLGLVALTATYAISARPRLSQDASDRFAAEVRAQADFDTRDDFFNVLSRSFPDSLKEGMTGFRLREWRTLDLITAANLVPVVAVMFYFAWRMLRGVEDAVARRRMWLLAVAVAASPLSLYLLGVDGGRWNTTCALDSFLVMLVLCRELPVSTAGVLRPAERNLIVLLLAFNMATGMGLFDQVQVNNFPFVPALFSSSVSAP